MQFGTFTIGDMTVDPTTGKAPSEAERIREMVAIAAEDWGSGDQHDGGLTHRIDRAAAELANLVAAREPGTS